MGADADRVESDLELAIFSGDEVRTFPLPPRGLVTIGRSEQSAVRIDDPSVSRNHAVLEVGPQLSIRDLGSANGTMLRSKAGTASASGETLNVRHLLQREAALAVGDSILLGTTSVVLRHKAAVDVIDLTTVGPGVIVRDPIMRSIYEQAWLAARSPISVLILGETGVGKEVLARAIHTHSRRSDGPFLGINCAALTESLQESELFGYEKGAFTGAQQPRPGLFESANGGTVFLDEVGELSASAQAKLLRVLEERMVTRLGSNRARPVDVRFVAATNRDLEAESTTGRFRQDLFFRLNAMSLLVPPLRDRPQEIEPLAKMFLAAASKQVERVNPPNLSTGTLEVLRKYRWPGNVRELRNAIDRATVLCLDDTVLPEHLPAAVLRFVEAQSASSSGAPKSPVGPEQAAPVDQGGGMSLQEATRRFQRQHLLAALEAGDWNAPEVARALGISRSQVYSLIRMFDLKRN
jgi:transcriptional regulator with GAF, ATPase, and Fis domain